jgi:hypothetical protein
MAGPEPVGSGTASNAELVASQCTSWRARAAPKAEENPKREGGEKRARVGRVGAWHVRSVVCTRVDEYENEGVGQVEGEQGDTSEKARVHREEVER